MSKFFKGVSTLFCLFSPIFLIIQVLIFIFNHKFYYAYFLGQALGGWENGIIEQSSNVFLFFGVIFSLISIRELSRHADKIQDSNLAKKILYAWFFLYLLGCIYYLGEEMSWGQHVFNWGPAIDHTTWHNLNVQGETNLHNLKGGWEFLFNRLPRTLLTVFVLLIGIVAPVFAKFNKRIKNFFERPVLSVLYGSPEIYISSAVSVLLILLGRKAFQIYKIIFEISRTLWFDYRVTSEVFESFLSIFLAAYAFSMLLKLLDTLNLNDTTSDKK